MERFVMTPYEMQLTREAAAISVAILPIYLTVETLLGFIKNDRWRTLLSVMLSGGLLHVGAEYSGLNQWYLEHSAIAYKMRPIVSVNDDSTVNYQDGVCRDSCPLTMDELALL